MEKSVEPVIKDMMEVHRIYRDFVWLPLKKDNVSREFELVEIKGKGRYGRSTADV